MALLVRGGEVVTAAGRGRADVLCEGECVVGVAPDMPVPEGAEVLDARDCFVFPGFVDPHVHVHLPLADCAAEDDYESASRAALLGGTTFFLDFCTPERDEPPLAALARWDEVSAGRSLCDYGYHMVVPRCDERVAAELREVVNREGIPSFKVYLAYPDSVGIEDGDLYRTLRLAAELGAVTCAHCENAGVVEARRAELRAAGFTDARHHAESRPPAVEALGTAHFLRVAELAGAAAYVVHLSCDAALEEALRARARGVRLWIEVLIQHLLLDEAAARSGDLDPLGAIMSPPLRGAGEHELLWRALARGDIDTVASDHAPFGLVVRRLLGEHDFTRVPNGLPPLEERVDLLLDRGEREHGIDLPRLVAAAAENPARIFGLYPRKGTIQAGSDADLVVWAPQRRRTISAATHASRVDYTPFEGWRVRGSARAVTVRGRVAVRDGEVLAAPGWGRRVQRAPLSRPARSDAPARAAPPERGDPRP